MARDQHQGITEQSKASKHRLDDAQALLNAGRWRGSMYMAGYAVECLLKAKLMRKFRCRTLSKLEEELQRRGLLSATQTVFTHALEGLLKLIGAAGRLRDDRATWELFLDVNRWLPAWRYNANVSSEREGSAFLASVKVVQNWIENNT